MPTWAPALAVGQGGQSIWQASRKKVALRTTPRRALSPTPSPGVRRRPSEATGRTAASTRPHESSIRRRSSRARTLRLLSPRQERRSRTHEESTADSRHRPSADPRRRERAGRRPRRRRAGRRELPDELPRRGPSDRVPDLDRQDQQPLRRAGRRPDRLLVDQARQAEEGRREGLQQGVRPAAGPPLDPEAGGRRPPTRRDTSCFARARHSRSARSSAGSRPSTSRPRWPSRPTRS